MIDKNIISDRKKLYGDNFKCIARMWTLKLRTIQTEDLTDMDVASMMALMKQCRINAIVKKLDNVTNKRDKAKLIKALEDSRTDMSNYLAIAENIEWYRSI